MFLLTLALLTGFQQINTYQTTGKDKDYNNNSTLYSFICDDDMMKKIVDKLDHIDRENENLRLKMDTMNMIMNYQFMELKTATTSGTTSTTDTTSTTRTETKNKNCSYSYDHLIDVRGDFNEQNECHHTTSATDTKIALPSSCAEAVQKSGQQSGVHKIRIPGSKLEPFYVYCLTDPQQDNTTWTIVQRRIDGSINFYRKWVEYQQGFGNLEGEFFIGLDKLHALTQFTLHKLWIKMEDFENNTRSANYSSFAIGGASEAYALNILGSYSGDAGDSLTTHAGNKFTTYDMDNDVHDLVNCAVDYTGAWWYNKCHESNLNGQYFRGSYPVVQYAKGINWYTWREHYYSLKHVHMAKRPSSATNKFK